MSAQLGDAQLGNLPLGGEIIPGGKFICNIQLSASFVGYIDAVGAFTSGIQLSANFSTTFVRVTQYGLEVVSRSVHDPRLRITQQILEVVKKYKQFECDLIVSASFDPSPSSVGRFRSEIVTSSLFSGTGLTLSIFSCALQVTANFIPTANVHGVFNIQLQLSAAFSGVGDLAGVFSLIIQMSASFIGPTPTAAFLAITDPDDLPAPIISTVSGSYVN